MRSFPFSDQPVPGRRLRALHEPFCSFMETEDACAPHPRALERARDDSRRPEHASFINYDGPLERGRFEFSRIKR
jgi:hypothetical protein